VVATFALRFGAEASNGARLVFVFGLMVMSYAIKDLIWFDHTHLDDP
jgi:hypothetical protein